MSRVTAPLLSLSASGKFANTMVASTWRGIPVMRHYVRPSNPQTPAQVAQRACMTALVSAYRRYVTNAEARTAWSRQALLEPSPMAGFNAFVRHSMDPYQTAPANATAVVWTPTAGYHATVSMLKYSDGTASTEAGNFELWKGTTPDSLLKQEDIAIAGGLLTVVGALTATASVIYLQVRKGATLRSGVAKITTILA